MSRGADSPTRIGFGGSRGSAKSRAGRDIPLEVALVNDGVLIYIVARNLGALEDNYVKKYRVERPDLMEYYKASPRPEINLPNGSTIAFRYADNKEDMTKLERGPEAFLVVVEQAEQFSEEELQQITKPNRWPSAERGAAKTVYLFNPGGMGTDYLRRVFYLHQYKGSERASDFAFIQAYGFDNWAWFEQECPELTEEAFYALPGDIPDCPSGVYDDAWLATVSDDHRFKMYVTRTSEGRKYWALPDSMRMGDLFGRFDKFAGQYFAGVWDERLCVLTSAKVDAICKWWHPVWIGGDWGFGHYAAIYWACTSRLSPREAWEQLQIDTEWPLDVVIIYREFVAQRMAEADLARKIVQMTPAAERAEIRKFVMGSDVFMSDRKSLHTIAQLIDAVTVEAGLPALRKAQDQPGSRVINARIMYEMLRRTSSMRSENPPKGRPEDKAAPLLFVSAECPQLIASIPLLLADEDKPDDVKKLETLADDVFDGCKYTCAEYTAVRDLAPREVRRAETMDRAGMNAESDEERNTAKYLAMLKFDLDEQNSERRPKKR